MTGAISDAEFDALPRDERAALMRDYARGIGMEMSHHEAGILADRHAEKRLAERESEAVAAHEGFGTGQGLRAYEAVPPWEAIDLPMMQRQRNLEPGE